MLETGINLRETAHEISKTNSYAALDLETTGLDPKRDKIIEIGALRVEDGIVTDEFSTFINPRRELDPYIVELTGITGEMLEEAPGIETVIGRITEFCGELPLLGHHIIFDYSFLKRAAVNHGIAFEQQGIDTLLICRRFMPQEEKKNLAAAARYFGIGEQTSHRALADARTAHLLYQAMRQRHFEGNREAFLGKPLIYKVKKEQPATKRQKEVLRDLIKYHKIGVSVQTDYLTRNEASRLTDQILFQYGRIKEVKIHD